MNGGAGPSRVSTWVTCVVVLVSLWGCASDPPEAPEAKEYGRPLPPGTPALEHVTDLAEIPDLRSTFSRRQSALEALDESLAYFGKPSSQTWFPYACDDRSVTHADQVRTLELLRDALVRSVTSEDCRPSST